LRKATSAGTSRRCGGRKIASCARAEAAGEEHAAGPAVFCVRLVEAEFGEQRLAQRDEPGMAAIARAR